MRPLRMLLQPACTRTKSDQAHSTSSITCACTRPASCCSVLQRPARQAARLPLSADPRYSVLSANQVRRMVTRRGEGPLPLSMSLRLLLRPQLHRQRLVKRLAVARSASPWVDCLRITKTSITDTNDVATVDRFCRQCTRFSDPACVTSRLPVHAQVPHCLTADCQATIHQAFIPVLIWIRRLRCQNEPPCYAVEVEL